MQRRQFSSLAGTRRDLSTGSDGQYLALPHSRQFARAAQVVPPTTKGFGWLAQARSALVSAEWHTYSGRGKSLAKGEGYVGSPGEANSISQADGERYGFVGTYSRNETQANAR